MTMNQTRSRYSGLRSKGLLHGTIKHAVMLRTQRDRHNLSAKRETLAQRFKSMRETIALGCDEVTAEAVQLLYDSRPKVQNWKHPRACLSASAVSDYDAGQYSSRCSYRKIEHTPRVRSWARAIGRRLHWRWSDNQVCVIVCPRPYRWDTDEHGIRLLARNGSDYHPTGADLRLGVQHCIGELRTNETRRRELAEEAKHERKQKRHERQAIRKAEREGLLACLADAVGAGHCRTGCLSWARQRGIDALEHHRPSRLLALANGDTHRIALVVIQAHRRHRREMTQGYSVLTDHRC